MQCMRTRVYGLVKFFVPNRFSLRCPLVWLVISSLSLISVSRCKLLFWNFFCRLSFSFRILKISIWRSISHSIFILLISFLFTIYFYRVLSSKCDISINEFATLILSHICLNLAMNATQCNTLDQTHYSFSKFGYYIFIVAFITREKKRKMRSNWILC